MMAFEFIDIAKSTIESYKADLKVIWVLILDLLNNKFFVEYNDKLIDFLKIHMTKEDN